MDYRDIERFILIHPVRTEDLNSLLDETSLSSIKRRTEEYEQYLQDDWAISVLKPIMTASFFRCNKFIVNLRKTANSFGIREQHLLDELEVGFVAAMRNQPLMNRAPSSSRCNWSPTKRRWITFSTYLRDLSVLTSRME